MNARPHRARESTILKVARVKPHFRRGLIKLRYNSANWIEQLFSAAIPRTKALTCLPPQTAATGNELPCFSMAAFVLPVTLHHSLKSPLCLSELDLISDVLPFDRLWYGEPNAANNAIGYAQHYSRSHDVVIRVFDASGNVIETHEGKGEFKEW